MQSNAFSDPILTLQSDIFYALSYHGSHRDGQGCTNSTSLRCQSMSFRSHLTSNLPILSHIGVRTADSSDFLDLSWTHARQ